MIVAIVGTSANTTENEELDLRKFITIVIKKYDPESTLIISGGSKGVDNMAKKEIG